HGARKFVLKALQHVATKLQLGDQVGRDQRTELDLNRTLALVVEELDRVEVLVRHGDAKTQTEDLIQPRSGLAAGTSPTTHFDRRRSAWQSHAGADGAEIDLRSLDPA